MTVELAPRAEAGSRPAPARPLAVLAQSPTAVTLVSFGALAFGVLAFAHPWTRTSLALDGPGVEMYLRLALNHARKGSIPYWLPEMWAGAPAWAVVPSFSTFSLVPLAWLIGPEGAIKVAILAFQVIGAWGAFVLARSLWGRRSPAPLVAGLLYGLHPLMISHGILFGQQPTTAVMAATPWLMWSLVRALRGDGPQYVAITGLLVGFTLLEQAEHVYGLFVLCVLLLLVQLVRGPTRRRGRLGPDGVLARAAAVVAIGGGMVAYWLLPFLSLTKSFVLSPPDLVHAFLEFNPLSNEPGAFLRRASTIANPISFQTNILDGPFYLSWVCIVLGLIGAVLLGRRDRDRRLTVLVCASAIGLWMSTGAIALAHSGPAKRGEVVMFIALGLVSGLFVGSFLRIFKLRRAVLAAAVATILLVTLPYLTPFVTTQRFVPLLASIRFPRLYPLAALGLAVAAAYPITFVHDWARRRQPSLAPMLAAAVCLAVVAAFLVDIHPYRSYYNVQRADTAAYQPVAATLAASSPAYRVANDDYAMPEEVQAVLDTGAQLSVGWPHPVSSKDLWPLTVRALAGPVGYRDRALGLSSTKYVVKSTLSDPADGPQRVATVRLEENPSVLPMVRAYEQAVVVADASVAPLMATDLAYKNIATVTGSPETAGGLAGVPATVLGPAQSCGAPDKDGLQAGVGGELAMACGFLTWMGADAPMVELGDEGSGAIFTADQSGLEGISVRLDRLPGDVALVLREVSADGRTLGREVARTTASGIDESKLAEFRFPRIDDSTGHRYAVTLSCPVCSPDDAPLLVSAHPPAGTTGDLIDNGQLKPQFNAEVVLHYERMAPAGLPTTTVTGTRRGPGRWSVESDGQRPAIVVVADSYFPGWTARVDGKPARVVEADGAFLGVAVGPGHHTVQLDYHKPAAALVGRIVTGLSLLGALVFLVVGYRRRPGARRSGRRQPGSAASPPPPRQPSPTGGPPAGTKRPRRWRGQRARPAPRPARPRAEHPASGEEDRVAPALPAGEDQPAGLSH